MSDFLDIRRGEAPLVISIPHSGSDIPAEFEPMFASLWLARKDADWWLEKLYDFAGALGATTIRTRISRSVIDCNRDPSGASLYPGQATTELCPTTSFDGEPLLRTAPPDDSDIERRRMLCFDPYHAAIATELERLRASNKRVVLYDAHSIRSSIPRLFDGVLPQFNIGTYDGASCDAALATAVAARCVESGRSHVVNGRFKGGWTTRHYGRPQQGIHAIQMELAIRGYHPEPDPPLPTTWPGHFDPAFSAPLTAALSTILEACIAFARS